MKTGTKSVLFGVHAFWWHPITVYLAWIQLYRRWPTFWQTIAIFFHDLGYWGSEKMDDEHGELHPVRAVRLMRRLFGWRGVEAAHQVLYHSRFLCARWGKTASHGDVTFNIVPSKLCWADKLSLAFDPRWFYLFRARLSGELAEYRKNAVQSGGLAEFDSRGRPLSDSVWFDWIRAKCIRVAYQQEHATARSR